MLDSSGNAGGNIQVGVNNFTGLPYLEFMT